MTFDVVLMYSAKTPCTALKKYIHHKMKIASNQPITNRTRNPMPLFAPPASRPVADRISRWRMFVSSPADTTAHRAML